MNTLFVLWSAFVLLCKSKKQPNIILILMDDLGYSDVGYNGGDIPTPSIDTLAAEGIRLNYNYVEMVCSATRSSLLTGRYAHKTGLNDGIALINKEGTDTSLKFISDTLSENNYDTLLFGKWHIGYSTESHLPSSRGFDKSLYFRNGQITYDQHTQCYNMNLMIKSGLMSGEIQPPPSSFLIPQLIQSFPDGFCGYDLWEDDVSYFDTDNGEYLEDILSDGILEYINNYDKKVKDDPFFIYWSMLTPHVPLIVPPQTSSICDTTYSGNDERVNLCNTMYYADKLIGDVVNALKTKKIYKNTVIIFVSDNGPQPFASAIGGGAGKPIPLRGAKLSPFEAGIRTPAIIGGGYIKLSNCDYNNIFHVTDYYPLIMTLAGIDNNDDPNLNDIDGINLLPNIKKECKSSPSSLSIQALTSRKRAKRDEFVSVRYCDEFRRSIVRTNEYKLVVNPVKYAACDPTADPSPFDPIFGYLQYWVDFDSSYSVTPDLISYNEFNTANQHNIDTQIFYSQCFESGLESVGPYMYDIDGVQSSIYLFDTINDNIEACNIAADNLDIVDELVAKLLNELPSYNGGGGSLNTEKGGILAVTDSYNCNNQQFTFPVWNDNPIYQNPTSDWSTIWSQYITAPACSSSFNLNVIHNQLKESYGIYGVYGIYTVVLSALFLVSLCIRSHCLNKTKYDNYMPLV